MGQVLNFAPPPIIQGPVTYEQAVLIQQGRATHTALNIRTPRTIKLGPGRLCRVFVIVAPTGGVVGLYDSASVREAGEETALMARAAELEMPCVFEVHSPVSKGITIDPGEGGILTASFN
jgi:hypothetical protein